MMKHQIAVISLLFSVLIFSASPLAEAIPEPLKSWQGWVQHQQEYRSCPFYANQNSDSKTNHICAWPGKMQLNIKSKSGSYQIAWDVIEDSWIPLPGNFNASTVSLTDNGKAATIRAHRSGSSVYLKKGLHQLQGRFSWNLRPEELFVPHQIAIVDLKVDGQAIMFPESSRGFIWLGEPRSTQKIQTNHTEIQVERLLTDGSPMQMRIKVYVDISGAARDEMLGKVLTEDMEIINISGDLASRIDAKGNLWAQLRPGGWEIDINLRLKGYPEKFSLSPSGEHWPKQEVWSWRSQDQLRITQISGVEAIEKDQAMNQLWDSLPHYLMNQESTFVISEKSRGMSEDRDRLSLQRTQWLNFSGDGYVFQDRITGFKTANWRLDMTPGYQLKSASSHNEELLITQTEAGKTGVEIRRPSINLITSGEVASHDADKVSGWSSSFDKVTTHLFIPPGRMLLAAPQADESYGDWLGYWSLWSLFSVLILIAIISRFISWKVAIPALITLVLGYYETGMPLILWFNLVIALVIAQRLVSDLAGKIASGYQLFSVLILVVALFPFLVDQIRSTLYPQLEMRSSLSDSYSDRGVGEMEIVGAQEDVFSQMQNKQNADFRTKNREVARSPMIEEDKISVTSSRTKNVDYGDSPSASKIVVTGSRIRTSDLIERYQPGALIQAGAALPDWRWKTAQLSWTGPIDAAEESSIIILGTTARALWRISLIVASVIWLIMLLPGIKKPDIKIDIHKATTSLILILGLFFLPQFTDSLMASELPDKEILKELQKRLYPAEECEPVCATLVRASVEAKKNQLILNLEYHTNAEVAVAIPTSTDWKISNLISNGKNLAGIFRNRKGNWIHLRKGIHHLKISGELSPKATISINFSQPPGIISTQGKGWEFAGISADKLSGNNLQLIRFVKPEEAQSNEQTSVAVKSFVKVRRQLILGNEWELNTDIQRIAPVQGALNLSIPLWEFEQPFIATKNISDNKMEVSLEPGVDSFSWRSHIKSQTQLILKSEDNPGFVESWEITASPMWNLQVDGIPLIYPAAQDVNDYWTYLFIPRAGEILTLKVNRPQAVAGNTLVIRDINVIHHPGRRGSESVLSLKYRATQAQQLPVTLSETANVSEVRVDGQVVNIRPEKAVLMFQAKTGAHEITIRWRDDNKIALLTKSPEFSVAGQYSNLTMTAVVPGNRWTLSVSGPGYGPVILYWGELLVFTLLAFGLSRLALSPLNFAQWLLLGLGMSTFSWPALAFVCAWLIGLGWRKGVESESTNTRIALQWSLAISTVIAVVALVTAIPYGLLSSPDMHISGNGSYPGNFIWFLDQGMGSLPQVSITSLPIWVYKALMLLWATWISFSLIKWVGWAWAETDKNDWYSVTKAKPVAKKAK